MIQKQAILKVMDNSGAKTVWCIDVIGGLKKRIAKLNCIIVVSIQQLWNNQKKTLKVKKKDIFKALVVKTMFKYQNKIGFTTKFSQNAVVLIDKNINPIGTRILGFIPKIILKKRFQKFATISKGFI